MLVSSVDFVKSPAIYLDKAGIEPVTITNDGREIAVLTKPNNTPVADSLLGLLRGSGIKNSDDIKAMRMKQ
jgi:hypothetical protein